MGPARTIGAGKTAIGYRVAPGTRQPGQARDAVRAVAWIKENIARHHGRPEGLYVGGHSAGAHLAALIATDEQFLTGAAPSAKACRRSSSQEGRGLEQVARSSQDKVTGHASARSWADEPY
jgi:carboxylesterase type B